MGLNMEGGFITVALFCGISRYSLNFCDGSKDTRHK